VGESVNLAILDSDEVVYIEHIASHHSLRTFTQIGNRVPCYCTGVGKILLAYLPTEKVDAIVGKKLHRYTNNTIADVDTLKKQLLTIKQTDLAVDNEENEIGVSCIAAPVKDFNGDAIAAISVSGPSVRLSAQRLLDLGPLVKGCALKISREMGYMGE
jgi:DNA-binding IclR family transcriptional regulator